MPAGMEIFNDAGTLLLDHNFTNIVLLDKGTVTTALDTATQEVPVYLAALPVSSGSGNRIAIRCTDTYAGICVVGYQLAVCTDVPATVEWFLFGPTPPASQTLGYGLQVYSSAGKLTFDSGNKHARHAGVISSSDVTGAIGGLDPARKYAAVPGQRSVKLRRQRGTFDGETYTYRVFSTSGVKFEATQMLFDDVDFATVVAEEDWGRHFKTFYLYDVTGY